MNLKPLQEQILLARISYIEAQRIEQESDYEIDNTMERKYHEGWLDALEHSYILMNGAPFEDN